MSNVDSKGSCLGNPIINGAGTNQEVAKCDDCGGWSRITPLLIWHKRHKPGAKTALGSTVGKGY